MRPARRAIRNEFIARQAQVLAEIDYARTIDADEMRRRVTLVDRSGVLAGGGKFVLVTGHSCNFEWMLLRLSLELGPGMMGIYKPMRGWGEQYFRKVRGRFGAQLLPSKAIKEEMARVREARVLGLVADQVPRTSPDRLWTRFLNQDTAFFKGPERMARVLRAPIVYGSMRRLGPGQYEVELEPLTAAGERLPGGAATERYARGLERDINARSGRVVVVAHGAGSCRRRSAGDCQRDGRYERSRRSTRLDDRCRRQLLLEVPRQLRDRRQVEQLRQVHCAGVQLVDLLVDLDQRQRARADVEQVVVDVDVLAGHRVVDDGLELRLDPAAGGAPMAVQRRPGRRRIRRSRPRIRRLHRPWPGRCAAACRWSSSGCASPARRAPLRRPHAR